MQQESAKAPSTTPKAQEQIKEKVKGLGDTIEKITEVQESKL